MMNDSILEDIYYTLIGELVPECQVPGVENAFASGGICDTAWLSWMPHGPGSWNGWARRMGTVMWMP